MVSTFPRLTQIEWVGVRVGSPRDTSPQAGAQAVSHAHSQPLPNHASYTPTAPGGCAAACHVGDPVLIFGSAQDRTWRAAPPALQSVCTQTSARRLLPSEPSPRRERGPHLWCLLSRFCAQWATSEARRRRRRRCRRPTAIPADAPAFPRTPCSRSTSASPLPPSVNPSAVKKVRAAAPRQATAARTSSSAYSWHCTSIGSSLKSHPPRVLLRFHGLNQTETQV